MSTAILDQKSIKVARTDYPIHPLLQERWSPRAFATKAVEQEKLRSILEAARWSESGGNMQPWAFIIAAQQDQPAAFAHMVDCLMPGNVPWASLAPVLGISVAKLLRQPGQPNRWAFHDVGLATQNLVIQASALGLYAHLMGGFSPEKARAAFDIPEDHDAVAMFALGYLGDPADLPEKQRESEWMPRTRRPLTDFVFTTRWGEASPLLEA